MGNSEHVETLERRCLDRGIGLLIIDHFSQSIGSVDENVSEIARIMGSFRSLTEKCNLALVLIHHQVKGFARFGISASESLRGHGSILASCDFAALVQRQVTNADGLSIKPAAVRGAPVDDIGAVFAFEQKPDGSGELQTARFFADVVEAPDARAEAEILSIVELFPAINQTALRQEAADQLEGVGDATIRKVISRLEREGKLVVEKGDKNSKIYTRGEDGQG